MTERPAKAKLTKLKANQADPAKPDTDGKPIDVQFNPATLKIAYKNATSGPEAAKGPRVQSPMQSQSTLSFDLEFDTAEDGVDVHTKVNDVLQFVRPAGNNKKDPPPRVLFEWGPIHFAGIVESITEDLDYFDSDGRALHAKLSLSITEQNLEFEAGLRGTAARTPFAASVPGAPPVGGPAARPDPNPTGTVVAQAGESVQQALSRTGADPAQWRTAMAGLTSPLNLAAGTPIQVGAQASASAGLGVATGFGAGGGVAVSASAALSGSVGASAETSAGFALSAGGGLSASARAAASASASAAVTRARANYVLPAPSVSVDADPRAATYGRGVPLKAHVTLR